MVGRYKVIRGVQSAAPGALPKISMDATDAILAGIVNSANAGALQFDIKPSSLAASGSFSLLGKDRGLGKTVSAQRATVAKIASEPLFNNKPAINCLAADGDGGSDLTMYASPPAGLNFTWFAVLTIDSVLKATPRTARILVVNDPVSKATIATLQLTPSGGIAFIANNGVVQSSIGVGSVPAANTPFVVAGSYNFGTLTSRVYLNNNTVIDEDVAATNPVFDPSYVMGIGSPTYLTTGNLAWHGKIARIVGYRAALSSDLITTVMNALKAEYGVSG